MLKACTQSKAYSRTNGQYVAVLCPELWREGSFKYGKYTLSARELQEQDADPIQTGE